jgi:hypothetical protein
MKLRCAYVTFALYKVSVQCLRIFCYAVPHNNRCTLLLENISHYFYCSRRSFLCSPLHLAFCGTWTLTVFFFVDRARWSSQYRSKRGSNSWLLSAGYGSCNQYVPCKYTVSCSVFRCFGYRLTEAPIMSRVSLTEIMKLVSYDDSVVCLSVFCKKGSTQI